MIRTFYNERETESMGDAVWYVLPWIIPVGGLLAVWLFIKRDERTNPEEYAIDINEE